MSRILMLTSEFLPFKGGIGTYARELAQAATQAGHEVIVVAPNYHADQAVLDGEFPFRVIRYEDGEPSMKGLLKRLVACRSATKSTKPDVIHAIDWPFFIPVRLAAIRSKARILLTIHGSEVIYMQARKRRMMLDAIRFWKKDWATWIGNSAYTCNLAKAAFPLEEANVRAIPLGVSDAWRNGRIDRASARSELGYKDEIVMMSLGRVVPRKGHAILAEALQQVKPEVAQRIRWNIVGPLLDEGHASVLRRLIESSHAVVSIKGPLSDRDVKLQMSAADIFCLPGYQDGSGAVEGFGLVFLEAAAYGVPSIATLSGGIPEAVEDNGTGLLVPEKDVAALARAIERIVEDDALRHRMAQASLDKAARATWHNVMIETYA